MRHLIAIALFIIVSTAAYAQAPYLGGNGDGYDMAELTLRTVSVENVDDRNGLHIYPNVLHHGEKINVGWDNEDRAMIQLVTIHGQLVKQVTGTKKYTQLSTHDIGAGMYILIVKTEDIILSKPIFVLE